jgi:hypothetical protein
MRLSANPAEKLVAVHWTAIPVPVICLKTQLTFVVIADDSDSDSPAFSALASAPFFTSHSGFDSVAPAAPLQTAIRSAHVANSNEKSLFRIFDLHPLRIGRRFDQKIFSKNDL